MSDSAAPLRPRGAGRAFRDGALTGLPFVMVGAPFALVFGAVAAEAGLDLLALMAVTSIVVAGASQFALVELLADGAPALVALTAALAVNLRLAMYSASLAPHLGAAPLRQRALAAFFLIDQVYALSLRRYIRPPELTVAEKMGYFFGAAAPMYVMWYLGSYVGAVAGSRIPPEWSLDFAPAVTFIALVGPMLRGWANIAAAFVAVAAALALAWAPWSLGLLVAAGLGMGTGVAVESALARRRAA